jgi:hypothetical protein
MHPQAEFSLLFFVFRNFFIAFAKRPENDTADEVIPLVLFLDLLKAFSD